MVERAGAECVAGAGGFDGVDFESRLVYAVSVFDGQGAVRSQGDKDQRDVVLVDEFAGAGFHLFDIGSVASGQEFNFVIGDFQDVAF